MRMKHVDGWLYIGISVFGSLTASLMTDEAKEFIPAPWRFYINVCLGALTAACLAAKMYRSTAYADGKAKAVQPPDKN
jgi:hypothetical protein